MAVYNISRQQIPQLIGDGRIFHAVFECRTYHNKFRSMVARVGVKKGQKGGRLAYDPTARGLLPVFDMRAKGYRMIPLANVYFLAAGGKKYSFNDPA